MFWSQGNLKFFLDIVPNSSADITRVLRGFFFVEDLFMLFRLLSKQRETSNVVGKSSLIF